MKRMKRTLFCLIVLTLFVALFFAACEAEIEEVLDELPVVVEVTGLEDLSGSAKVTLPDDAAKADAIAAIKKVYYVADDAETYAVDIAIEDEEGHAITLDKPVTVSILINLPKLPLDSYLIFHVHDGKAEEVRSILSSDGKLTFTVQTFSPFVIIPKHTHVFSDWTVDIEASTCGEMGIEKSVCVCGESRTRDYERLHELTHFAGKNATCTAAGEKEHWDCSVCGKKFSDEAGTQEINGSLEISPLGHVDKNEDNKCDNCGATLKNESNPKDPEASGSSVEIPLSYKKEGDFLYFGAYPQTRTTDAAIVSALNAAAGELPTRTDFHDWTSYGYYVASEQIDSIFYIDLTYQDIKYRGVCLTGYRPSLTTDTALPAKTHQYENGYLPGSTVYWFRYEPIKWRILEESEGSALLICDMILDSQAFQNTATRSEPVFTNDNPDTPEGIYGNNYRYSTIRAWLNEDFCQTAFTALQKGLILLTTVNNDGTSAQPTDTAWNNSSTTYLCEDTEDYVFLPSEAEITDPDYGFPGYFAEFDDAAARKRLPTDYAVSQGLDKYDGGYESVVGYGPYWLRSPRSNSSGEACKVIAAGSCHSGDIVLNTSLGVVPMLRISLS